MTYNELGKLYDEIAATVRAILHEEPFDQNYQERVSPLLDQQDKIEEQMAKLAGSLEDPRRDPSYIRKDLERDLELSIRNMIDRRRASRVQQIIPGAFFSAASRECRDMFVHGHFYGCITLAQSVAEGLSMFLYTKEGRNPDHDHHSRRRWLVANKIISADSFEAFKEIEGKDRNDFHHFNKDVLQDRFKLEDRAAQCVKCLYIIESDVFAFAWGKGGTVDPKTLKYWLCSKNDPNGLDVYIDSR